MKTIYIEGLGLVDGHFSGIGQYILGILKGLDEQIEQRKFNGETPPEIKVLITRDTITRFRSFGLKHIGYRTFPFTFRTMSGLWHRRKMPPIDLWFGPGTYIFPRFVNMPLLFSKSALVIYDLSFELHRQYSDEGNARFLATQVKKSLASTNKVITISQNAKAEIERFYNLNGNDVIVATPATDPRLFYRRSEEEINKAKLKYEIKGNYILALSNLEPRKNLDSLVEAYCRLPETYRKDTALLLVGVSGWKTDKLFSKIIEKVEQGYNIIRPAQYVLDEDKPAIISGAKMLVYPSHYEGFGMPPLEALACGVPVITSDNSSLPEVVGGVGQMVDSTDIAGLRSAILQYLKNSTTVTARTVVTGPKKATEFSWKDSAQIFLDVAGGLEK
ncbi:MAG TPA: glycosyltransferase family 1 protein [Candidatus Saccharimonadales bacterium]|nr:glycosyltransferase family 1 protein [Candidatus Saccharimonadales bacterium]